MSEGGDGRDDDSEVWVPLGKGGDAPQQETWRRTPEPTTGGPKEPEDMIRQFFEMQKIPDDAEVVVAPSMRAAIDVPLKVGFVLLILFGPFTATGFMFDGPSLIAPLAFVFTVMQFWPLLIFVFAPAFRLKFTRYVVDAEGVRSRTQLLSVTEERISWDKVTAILHRRTLLDRLLGLERLNIIAYGERGATLRLIGLRNAKQLRDLTAQKMREHATAEAIFSND